MVLIPHRSSRVDINMFDWRPNTWFRSSIPNVHQGGDSFDLSGDSWCFCSDIPDWEKLQVGPRMMLALCLYWQPPGPGRSQVGCVVEWWSGDGAGSVLCDQSVRPDGVSSSPLSRLQAVRLSGSPLWSPNKLTRHGIEHFTRYYLQHIKVKNFIQPPHCSGLIIGWRVPFYHESDWVDVGPIIIQSFDHLAV